MNQEEYKQISGATEAAVWQQITQDLTSRPDLLQYRAILNQGPHAILFDLDIDLGGGFESGFATTIFSARFANPGGFGFALYPEHFTDTLGKAFGMQDVEIGYPDFDKKLIVKSTDAARVATLFTHPEVRQTLLELPDFSFELSLPDEEPGQEESVLELYVEEGITDPARLQAIYHAFVQVLQQVSR